MKIYLFILLVILSVSVCAQKTDTINLKSFFGDFTGGFSVYDINTGNSIQYNSEQCKKRFSPCSTFKILNSLIGLQTGIIPDTAFVIKYDSILHPKDSFMLENEPYRHWFEDLSLKMAFKNSCVWYYQELARRIGTDRMEEFVKKTGYGNMDTTGGIDNFWLCRSLEISINEQVEFLRKMYLYQLDGFSVKTIDAVKSIMLYEEGEGYKLYGKTGGGNCLENSMIGWYVGFVETSSGTKIFAMNIIVNNFGDLKNNFRIEITRKILKELKII